VRDHRVRREAATLIGAGFVVTVICPRDPGEDTTEVVDGVRVLRYRKPRVGEGILGHVLEYGASLFWMMFLSLRVRLGNGFRVLQLCNPPDFLFPVGLLHRWLGARIVFDHHDLCPELFVSRFGPGHPFISRILRACEWITLRHAHHVITTNDSYRRLAIERGGVDPDRVTVVRNGPCLSRFDRRGVTPAPRSPGRVRVGYVGNMNPQDGVDLILELAGILCARGDESIEFVCIGGGDSLSGLSQEVRSRGLEDRVTFTGRVSDERMLSLLVSCDIGIQPDPPGPLNDLSTMNKVLEYMALELPVVAFSLPETRVSCGEAALYADNGDVEALADHVVALSRDGKRRRRLGQEGRRRIEERLAWSHSEAPLLRAYALACGEGQERAPTAGECAEAVP